MSLILVTRLCSILSFLSSDVPILITNRVYVSEVQMNGGAALTFNYRFTGNLEKTYNVYVDTPWPDGSWRVRQHLSPIRYTTFTYPAPLSDSPVFTFQADFRHESRQEKNMYGIEEEQEFKWICRPTLG